MTGILDSLINVMLSLEGGFQSTDNKYLGIINVITPRRCSFKVMHPMYSRPEDGFLGSTHNKHLLLLAKNHDYYIIK